MEVKQDIIQYHIEHALAGAQKSFRFLLNTYWDELYHFQLKRAGDPYEAEEITIQAFAKAFEKLEQYDTSFQFNTWLLTISKHIQIDLARKKKSDCMELTVSNGIKRCCELENEDPSPEDLLIAQQDHNQLQHHLRKLPCHYRQILWQRYFKEYSYKELARANDESLSAVKVKVFRAKRILADSIKELH
ncbi:RNA polymerase sigma factor [Croceiramulus getboli]|nr:sigma-70 family RNA polymerase sigma factor [Flavobacteriaceae bacterium YJPT1-3]